MVSDCCVFVPVDWLEALHNYEACRMTLPLFCYSWQSSWVSLTVVSFLPFLHLWLSLLPLLLSLFFPPLCLSPFLSLASPHISLSPLTAVWQLLPTFLCSWSETELICSSDSQSPVYWAACDCICAGLRVCIATRLNSNNMNVIGNKMRSNWKNSKIDLIDFLFFFCNHCIQISHLLCCWKLP